jgi:predicted aspartyl protease
MNVPFNAKHGPILVEVEVTGPARSLSLELILDTGATTTVLSETVVSLLGFDLSVVTSRAQLTTGGSVISVPRVTLTRMTALGSHRFGFPVLAYTLSTSTTVKGLLGLDFFRGHVLSIDFRNGRLTLA